MQKEYENFIHQLLDKFSKYEKLNKVSVENIAKKNGINDQLRVKELTEFAIVQYCREIVFTQLKNGKKAVYNEIVNFYTKNQVNLSLRTSTSMILEQYSTPAPIAFLSGLFCGILNNSEKKVLEPSAGNGMMTIAAAYNVSNIHCNEIDDYRYQNLLSQNFYKVTKFDASKPLEVITNGSEYDAIIANPPFGTLKSDEFLNIEGYTIKKLEHLMTIRALNAMKDSGRAAIIVGGNVQFEKDGYIKRGNTFYFLNYLYEFYNVVDVINIDGQLYRKMGTTANITMILIDGRKKIPQGFAPRGDDKSMTIEDNFDSLYNRVFIDSISDKSTDAKILKAIVRLQYLSSKLEIYL